jgi:hypothetical protein
LKLAEDLNVRPENYKTYRRKQGESSLMLALVMIILDMPSKA